jgi:small multidrug resistance family-3 protein
VLVARSIALFVVAPLFDIIGALVCLVGMAVIMYAPRGH